MLTGRSGAAVALKVLRHGYGRRELAVLQRLQQSQHLETEYVVQLLDYFEHFGRNGTHLCLVLELMWQDLMLFFQGYYDNPGGRLRLVKPITKQILRGLESLHSTCGLVHNGSLVVRHFH